MDQTAHALLAANLIYSRAESNTTANGITKQSRPPVYKAIGIALAIGSGVFIGISFVLKKIGLLRANEKYAEVAGEGYGYLKNVFWWGGMTLMILGEVMNAGAYAFVDAILVAPMGALSVVVTTILSAIFLKERLSLVGKIGCFLCILGSVVIAMNSPSESSVANIQEMQHFVIAPGFLSFAGVVLIGCAVLIFWAGPRYGKKSMFVYLSICSLMGGLSVVATQGLGAAIVAQIGGKPQFNQWFIYVLLVFVVFTLVTEIIYLNKALNLFNAALVTPTYYVIFTSCTIITSVILFRGFKGTPTSIITVVLGFFTICAGVVLLQLSKSAKDVPDAAVFSGDLDQVRTIAEQEQSEMEPKADAIRGAAAIVRRFSQVRDKNELAEAKRLHEEKQQDLEPIGENEHIEWDGLRRRRTTYGSNSVRSRHNTTPFPDFESHPQTPVQHPPLGMSRFPSESDLEDEERPNTGSSMSFFARARSIVGPRSRNSTHTQSHVQSPMHPVPLTEINLPGGNAYYGHPDQIDALTYGMPTGKTEYQGAGERHITIVEGHEPRLNSSGSLHPSVGPTPPPHSARRQFSFQNIFRKGQSQAQQSTPEENQHQAQSRSPMVRQGLGSRRGSTPAVKGATEEERLGLVKGDTNSSTRLPGPGPVYDDEEEEDGSSSSGWGDDKARMRSDSEVSRDLTSRPVRADKGLEAAGDVGGSQSRSRNEEESFYEEQRRKWAKGGGSTGRALPPPPPDEEDDMRGGLRSAGGRGRGGAFI
ncbi:related to DUF803 domain membrane protein [Rhynchosporium secalis]|uniref:Related to DUF803 domain membrane protein n=1 Tax=Rhynchosporium secalis TaxID=38038 RepID=A0A1E1M3A7_RHYSE|nr:related to DUF803 domain membrane protein [Rhynchosporium secalis]